MAYGKSDTILKLWGFGVNSETCIDLHCIVIFEVFVMFLQNFTGVIHCLVESSKQN